jgi:broad specificity phosphatase PhoE
MKDILFIFFNGGGNTFDQWYKHPYEPEKTTNLIERIKQIGDIFLYNPVFYYDGKNQQQFKLKNINFDEHCEMLIKQTEPYNHYFLISHSRGWMLANHFAKKYNPKVIGNINFDGGETLELTQKRISEWRGQYEKYSDSEISNLIEEINSGNKESQDLLSRIVKYHMYLQYLNAGEYQPECNTVIFNNIYDNNEINISDQEYVKDTLQDKFKYNAQFRSNLKVTSKWYVSGEQYGHFVYFGKEDEIIAEIKKITCDIFDDKEIYIIRHGQTDWNKHGIPQGAGNDIDLNSVGRSQATKTGIYLKQNRMESGEFDAIISSPMARALNTAKLIAKEIGYTKPIILMDELTELDFGLTASGKKTHEMRKDPFYDEYYKLHDERKSLDKIKRRELMFEKEPEAYTQKYKIESVENVINRMKYIQNYILQHGYKKMIIVTHGGTIDWLHRIILNIADYLGAVKNCSIAYYRVEKCVFRLLMVSSDEHLEDRKY